MRNLKNLVRAASLAAVALVAVAALADAPIVTHVDGEPDRDAFRRGDTARYAVWHEHDGAWQLAVTTAGARHHFKGRVYVEGAGTLEDVRAWKGWGEEHAEEREGNVFADSVSVAPSDAPKELFFDVVSEAKNVSAITFKVAGTGTLLWELCIGGGGDADPITCDPTRVRIGRDGQEPEAVPFKTRVAPDAPDGGN